MTERLNWTESHSWLPWWLSGKESACQCKFDPWVRKIPWRRKWQPTPVFLFGQSHGQRSLVAYSPWGHQRVRDDLGTKQQSHSPGLCPNHLLKTLPPNNITLWKRFQFMYIGRTQYSFYGNFQTTYCLSLLGLNLKYTLKMLSTSPQILNSNTLLVKNLWN